MSDLYERDFYAWANEQASLLRAGKLAAADIANIAEEIESIGRQEKRELIKRLTGLLVEFLKFNLRRPDDMQAFRLKIEILRANVAEISDDSPSLALLFPELLSRAYEGARFETAIACDIEPDSFGPECPWTFDQAMHGEA
jgi:phenylpyruvate tautomerase PptA (4-oxalocrotonate tautomerase family)